MNDIARLRRAAASDTEQCPACYNTGGVCDRCLARYRAANPPPCGCRKCRNPGHA